VRSDQELAARVAGSDDQQAFTLLVERHQAVIRQFLRRLTAGEFHAADDLAQETFLLAYRKIHTFRSTGSFSSWLHTIAYRQFLVMVKRQARFPTHPNPPDPSHDSRNQIEAEIMAQKLMGLLSPRERAVVTLSFAEGMSHGEISAITGMPLGTIKSQIQRGKQKMKRWVDENDHSLPQTSPKDPTRDTARVSLHDSKRDSNRDSCRASAQAPLRITAKPPSPEPPSLEPMEKFNV
jgi:RNA polymerase sigma-70 factor (ECF subfamily)